MKKYKVIFGDSKDTLFDIDKLAQTILHSKLKNIIDVHIYIPNIIETRIHELHPGSIQLIRYLDIKETEHQHTNISNKENNVGICIWSRNIQKHIQYDNDKNDDIEITIEDILWDISAAINFFENNIIIKQLNN